MHGPRGVHTRPRRRLKFVCALGAIAFAAAIACGAALFPLGQLIQVGLTDVVCHEGLLGARIASSHHLEPAFVD